MLMRYLLFQIQHNLFTSYTKGSGKMSSADKDNDSQNNIKFCPFKDVEDNYVKSVSSHEAKGIIYLFVYVFIYLRMHTYIHACTNTHTHTYTHCCLYVLPL